MQRSILLVLTVAILSACSGGGGGSSTPGTPASPPTPSPTPTVPPSLTGTLSETASGAPLGGFTVTVGLLPNVETCLNAQTQTANPCGSAASPTTTVTTAPNGAFTVPNISLGTQFISIGNGTGAYATLHRLYDVTPGVNAIGAVTVSQLSSDEQAWLADINNDRATISYPTSFANLTIDEYAEEEARAEAAAVASGAEPYGDSTESIYCTDYDNAPGADGVSSGVSDLQPQPSAYVTVDNAFFSEKSNCPNGDWQTCTFAENTGHYINLSSTSDVWIGVGESAMSYSDPPYGNEYAYAAVIPGDYYTAGPASIHRTRVDSMMPTLPKRKPSSRRNVHDENA